MHALLFESSNRITLVIAVTALALYAFRIRSAAARHSIWTAVLSMMLLMPIVISWAPGFWLHVLPEREQPVRAPIVVAMTDPAPTIPAHTQSTATPSTELSSPISWRTFVFGAWAFGAAFFLFRLAVGTHQVHRLLANATFDRGRRVHPACTTPITVGWWRPAMILPTTWTDWPEERLLAVTAHEQQHILRRDPLIHWVALLNRSIFWFHPLAWWLEREIATLAEAACDEAVLAQGIRAEDYSNALVFLARAAHDSGARLQLGTAMPGPALYARLRAILDGARPQPLSPWRWTCIATVISAAIFVLSRGNLAEAQPPLAFEVAAIKLHPGMWRGVGVHISGTSVTIESMTVRNMLTYAYDFRPFQAEGGDKWTDQDRYDITARAPGDTPPTQKEVRAMILTLLKERFTLREHRSSKEMPVYALTVSPKGHRLTPADKPENPPAMFGMGGASREGTATYKSAPAGMLATSFFVPLDRPIVDQTGLTGKYDYALKLTSNPDGTVTGPSGESIFTAVEEQLGLKLENARASIEVLVIDSADRPTEN